MYRSLQNNSMKYERLLSCYWRSTGKLRFTPRNVRPFAASCSMTRSPPLGARRQDLAYLSENDIANIERIIQSGSAPGRVEAAASGNLLAYNSDWTGAYRMSPD